MGEKSLKNYGKKSYNESETFYNTLKKDATEKMVKISQILMGEKFSDDKAPKLIVRRHVSLNQQKKNAKKNIYKKCKHKKMEMLEFIKSF